jgi:hypothetical protein
MKNLVLLIFVTGMICLISFQAPGQGTIASGANASNAADHFKLLPTGEFEIGQETISGPESSTQDNSSVAFNGLIYLVVWSDSRSHLDRDIYGARVDAAGNLLDPAGFIICNAEGTQRNPSVTTNGDIFMVVWEDQRDVYVTGTDIYGARVSGDGVVLDLSGIEISTATDEQTLPAVGSAEGNFFTVWVDQRSGTNNDIYGAFITGNGSVANPDGLVICDQAGYQNAPDICYNGSRYLLVWADQRGFSKDIYGTFLKTDGTLSHANGIGIITLFNNQENPSIAWNGAEFFLAYEEYQTGYQAQIHGGRLNAAGQLLDVNSIEIAAYDLSFCSEPRVTAVDSDFLVAYSKGDGDFTTTYSVIGKRISMAGEILDPNGLQISPGNCLVNQMPALAFGGTDALITWTDDRNGHLDIYTGHVTPSGNVTDPQGSLITSGYNAQLYISLAFDGTNYLAVWCDTRNTSGFGIYAARINDGGTVLDPEAIQISSGGTYNVKPVVAFNGTHYLVVWDKDGDIYGARITKDGVVADPGGFAIYSGEFTQYMPSVASDGENWMVTWSDRRNDSQPENYSDLYGAIVNASGTVQQAEGFLVASATQDQYQSDLIFSNGQFVVAWEDYRAGFVQPDIYAARISTDGTVLDNNGVGILTGNDITIHPKLAFDGTNMLLCWQEYSGSDHDVKAIRLDQSLAKLDAQPVDLNISPRDQVYPCVAWNGEHYMVLWMDRTALMVYRISMAKVLPDGTVAETGVLSEMQDNLLYPSIVHGPLKQVLTGFSAFMETIEAQPVNALRAMGLLIGQGQGPGIAESDPGIISRFEVFPNPASDHATVDFELAEKSPVVITLLSTEGKTVRTLYARKSAAAGTIMNISLQELPEGMYFVRMQAGRSAVTQKFWKSR